MTRRIPDSIFKQRTRVRARGAEAPELRITHVPRKSEGAGNAGCPRHPQPVCIDSKHTVVTTSTPDHPAFPAQWFYGLCRALPGDEFVFVTVAPRIDGGPNPVGLDVTSTGLGISNGCQDHTVLPYAATSTNASASHVLPAEILAKALKRRSSCAPYERSRETRPAITSRARRCRVHRILPRVRDDRDTPLCGEDGGVCRSDLG
jgi:hypothetical protein